MIEIDDTRYIPVDPLATGQADLSYVYTPKW